MRYAEPTEQDIERVSGQLAFVVAVLLRKILRIPERQRGEQPGEGRNKP